MVESLTSLIGDRIIKGTHHDRVLLKGVKNIHLITPFNLPKQRRRCPARTYITWPDQLIWLWTPPDGTMCYE